MKQSFDFENERYLTNTISIFEDLLFEDENIDKVTLVISNIENTIIHAKAGLSFLYDLKPDNRDEVYNWLEYQAKEVIRLLDSKKFELKEDRFETLNIFQNIFRAIFKKPLIVSNKLIINASQSVIFDLIQQLKITYVNGQTPFLSQTNEDIAEFLINNVEGFQNSSLSTITKELARKKDIMKAKLKVVKIN